VTDRPLDCQRSLFSLPEDLHYLNCAYMGPLSRDVEAAGVRGIARKAVPSAITARDFFDESDIVRGLFARLVNAGDPNRIAILPAASYGIATAARNTPCATGQNIVTAAEQFPSNVHVWRSLARSSNAEFRMIGPPAGAARGQGWNEALLDAIDAGTAAVALPHVHWTDGTRFDLEAIGRRAREVGAALVVDATQC
jgi:selenocysteine lyase/cysteine desulfurase